MRNRIDPKLLILAVCGTAAGLAQTAAAQPFVVNLSGATLLENFVASQASTNDFIDCDNDGVITGGGVTDQMARTNWRTVQVPPYDGSRWIVTYRLTGSVAGFNELLLFGCGGDPSACFVYEDQDPGPATDLNNGYVQTVGATCIPTAIQRAYANREQYINANVVLAIGNTGNPGATPVTSTTDDLYTARPYLLPNNPMGGGYQVDLSPVDVASTWAVQGPAGTSAISRTPATLGYGQNSRRATNKAGAPAGGSDFNTLPQLGNRRLASATLPPYPTDNDTIFDTPLAFASIALITNLGTGIEQMAQSNVRHTFASGRTVCGENLIVVTRDVGSGTRNAFNNATCTDPSWGVGDNIGARNGATADNTLGTAFLPSNKNGTGAVEVTCRNHRLAVGYVGSERGVENGWLTNNQLEIIAVQFDLQGGTQFSRPTINDLLDNDANGWLIGGNAIIASVGDPRAEAVADGGDNNGNPRMCNTEAACYLNNITRSIENFIAVPGGADDLFTPGERAAQIFILASALDNLAAPLNGCQLVVNPAFSLTLQNYIRLNNVHTNPAYVSFGLAGRNGRNPTRTGLTGANVYSDNVALGANYVSQGGAILTYGQATLTRNRIAADFNGDGLRNINDAEQMLRAFRQRNGGPVWAAPAGSGPLAGAPGNDACIEILGDFDGDGNFGRRWTGAMFVTDTTDVRYWADGLGLNAMTGKLNRRAAFTAVDNAWNTIGGGSSNFFGTTQATGTYAPGNSCADVAGPLGVNSPVTRGFTPIGFDGVINANDIDYIRSQFKDASLFGDTEITCVVDGVANWGTNVDEAACTDLSADLNGDLTINEIIPGGPGRGTGIGDVDTLVLEILGTEYGDVNLDGAVNAMDEAIVMMNQGTAGGWARGDINGDFLVNELDLAFFAPPACPGDYDGDGTVGIGDIAEVNLVWAQPVGPGTPPDADMDGIVGLGELAVVINNWGTVCK